MSSNFQKVGKDIIKIVIDFKNPVTATDRSSCDNSPC